MSARCCLLDGFSFGMINRAMVCINTLYKGD